MFEEGHGVLDALCRAIDQLATSTPQVILSTRLLSAPPLSISLLGLPMIDSASRHSLVCLQFPSSLVCLQELNSFTEGSDLPAAVLLSTGSQVSPPLRGQVI